MIARLYRAHYAVYSVPPEVPTTYKYVFMIHTLSIALNSVITHECQVIWTDSAVYKTTKLREGNNLT